MVDSIGQRPLDRKIGAVSRVGTLAAAKSVTKQPQAAQAPTVASQLAASAPVDTARVERIKQAIAKGEFPLSPTTIAEDRDGASIAPVCCARPLTIVHCHEGPCGHRASRTNQRVCSGATMRIARHLISGALPIRSRSRGPGGHQLLQRHPLQRSGVAPSATQQAY